MGSLRLECESGNDSHSWGTVKPTMVGETMKGRRSRTDLDDDDDDEKE